MPHQCTNCGHTFPDGSKEMLSGCPDCGGNKFQFAPNPDSTTADSEAGGDRSETREEAGSGSETASEGVASRAADTVRSWVSSESVTESTDNAANSSAANEPAASAGSADLEEDDPTAAADSNTPPAGNRDEANADRDGDSFAEWPDSARRPEDRSFAPEETPIDDADGRSGAQSTDEPATDPRSDSATDTREREYETATMAESEDSAQASARSEVVPADDLPSGSSAAQRGDPITEVDPIDDGERERTPDNGRVVSEPSGERPSIEELRAELNEQFESIKILRPGQYELNLMELYNREEYIISLQEDGRYVIDVPESWHDDADE